MRFHKGLSPRRVRIIILLGILLALIAVLATFDGPFPSLSSRFRHLTEHNTSSGTETIKRPPPVTFVNVRWYDFAYVQYVTNSNYLCNSLMIFEALRRHETKADLLLMYPQEWPVPAGSGSGSDYEGRLLAQAQDHYGAKLSPIQVKTIVNQDDATWQDSYTKLLAWNQTQYKRVISLDSDATILDHMDELFFLPSAPVAMPRAYWMDQFFLSSQIIVIEPSQENWERVQGSMEHQEGHDYDMDILNKVFGKSTLVIPHRRYDLLSGEFRNKPDEHEAYLGSPTEKWKPKQALAEAKFVHFSDWPMPKPWLSATEEHVSKYQPECRSASGTEQDCTDRDVWLELRKDFSERRMRVCGQAYD